MNTNANLATQTLLLFAALTLYFLENGYVISGLICIGGMIDGVLIYLRSQEK